ncbi:hydrolase [Streptacidiphilus cavernicola]|uniref:Hydrolase n=1 Tax=Streptacidiphilus cavernicola TaxID=3342716 RepID=A0ABV6VWS7_9ACTN
MSLWTSLEPASTTVDAGGTATVRLRLRNTADVVDEYRFVPVGEIAPYVTVEPPSLRLYPGTTGTVHLTFAPPRTPDATAGPNPYAVQIIPTEYPESTVVPEGNLTITPFTEMRAELVPHTVKGRFRGRPRLAIDNFGNTALTVSVTGNDNGDQLSYDLHPANVRIEPGRAAFVQASLRPRRLIWFGHKQQRPYRLAVRRSGSAPLDVEGSYIQRGFLPRWLATLLTLLCTLALAFVALWFTAAAPVTSQATAEVQQPVATALPTPAAPPTPAATVTPSAPPSPTQTAGGGGGATTKPSAKPKIPDTAANAVKRAAAITPGRHICYRAYVADLGWQHTVCDGGVAGTENQSRAIEALNIAVSGIDGGDAATAWLSTEKYLPAWKAAPAETDITVGTPGSAIRLEQVVVSTAVGVVCGNGYILGQHWQTQTCDDPGGPRSWITLGKQGIQLEAVQFTV